MKTTNVRTTILALFAALALAGAGCGGTTNTPPGTDAGHDAASAPLDTGVVPGDGGSDSGPTPTTDAGLDAGAATDAGSDAGPCVSTMAHCNTCVTAATDPLNACAPETSGCIPFDNTRVPGWPDHIPAVTP